jgi:phosphonoacetate hydrolase
MQRRHFLFTSLAAAAAAATAAAPQRKVLICLIDGFGPDYIERSDMPTFRKLMKEGVFKMGKGLMPSLTNVNNASFATGTYPSKHGITSNTYLDRRTGKVMEMSSPSLLNAPTVFHHARKRGQKTALVAAKHKIYTLLGADAGRAFSAEKPSPEAIALGGAAPNMYSPESNYWTFRVGRALLRSPDVDLLYLTTTDYMMHTYAADEAPSLEHLHNLDKRLAEILGDHPNLELYLTADHGMNAKTQAIDPIRVLAAKRIDSIGIPAISDRHKAHHKDLGGSMYIDLKDPDQIRQAMDALLIEPGIEAVYDRKQAAKLFHLDSGRIGDLFVIADKQSALGLLPETRQAVKVRTHGSLHEVDVPLLVWGRKIDPAKLQTSIDLSKDRLWETE